MTEVSSTVKVPMFVRNDEISNRWWIKFQAYARVKGFIAVSKDARIIITKLDVEDLDKKPKYGSREAGAKT